ncbi:MAG: winged helix-turn-helix transcriptional regulator [Hyphomicrobiaceae bacterium]|nr:MAG: winged helix-turn-helix transcriptional regulator [Hyphomicrobiaceae bacterium]
MSDKPSASAIDAWSRLVRAEQALLSRVEDDLKREGLPPLAWYDMLYELDQAPEGMLRQAAVQEHMLLAQYNLCRLVDRLEREGLVERRTCPEDARSNVLIITEAGRKLRARMWPAYGRAIEAHLGRRLSREDAERLAAILGKLLPSKPEE